MYIFNIHVSLGELSSILISVVAFNLQTIQIYLIYKQNQHFCIIIVQRPHPGPITNYETQFHRMRNQSMKLLTNSVEHQRTSDWTNPLHTDC